MDTLRQDLLPTPAPAGLFALLLRQMLASMGNPALQFVLWNGDTVIAPGVTPVARVSIADRAALLKLSFDPELQFGELYTSGRIEVEGDLERLLTEVYRAARRHRTFGQRLLTDCIRAARSNTPARSRHNVEHHYDLGNDFYSLWLDESMAYTCAYFARADMTLAEAQAAKMNHVSRKLRLQPGQTVVEAGCGWGGLALHMARHFGVRVRSFNLSREQLEFARARARAEDLADRIEFVEDDYRNIAGSYDAFVSVGMLEHVGVDHYRELGRLVRRCLKPEGCGLIHSIGRNRPAPVNRWIEKHIFPGGYTPSLREMMEIFEPQDFSVLDVENLRLHYARTLFFWRAAFERAADEVAALFDASFVRMWRLYLAGSAAAFNAGDMQLFQIVFAPQGSNAVPLTREHLYRE